MRAARGACLPASRTRRNRSEAASRASLHRFIASSSAPYTARRCQSPIRSCRHASFAAEASAPARRTADHVPSPACGGPRGLRRGRGEPSGCPRGEPGSRGSARTVQRGGVPLCFICANVIPRRTTGWSLRTKVRTHNQRRLQPTRSSALQRSFALSLNLSSRRVCVSRTRAAVHQTRTLHS